MKYVIGISLGYNASACIMDENQNVVYAASEERFINVKNCKEFPLTSIKNGIDYLGINPDDIVVCNYCHYQEPDLYDLYRHTYKIDKKVPSRRAKLTPEEMALQEELFIRQHLLLLGIDVRSVNRINHHHAHAACAYNLSPFHDKDDDATNLYVVMDGFGDGDSISMWVENENALDTVTLDKIYSEPMCKSVALVYQFVTGALGYKEHQHEGKITGLAAFGDPGTHFSDFKKLYNEFVNISHYENVDSPIIDFDIFTEMKKRTYALVNSWTEGMTKEEKFEKSKDIAASVQAFAESEAFEYVTKVIYENGFKKVNLNLAGGLFANVKINQMLHEKIREVQNVFVAPPMGDEGTCIGAACGTELLDRAGKKMTNMTMRMGTSHGVDEIGEVDNLVEKLKELDVKVSKVITSIDEVSKMIAQDLSENKIVCVFDGRMEFGPRALIGRSIMYNCHDKGANDWLNHQLGRTEYMPFAPFCKEEHVKALFEKVEGKEQALKNMTITVKGTEEFIENYPAACHIDNTARPQVISKDENEFAWMILDAFENLTGDKTLINTSFNLHNYPIIESTKVAVESWLTSNTHSLYIGGDNEWIKLSR